MEPEKHLAELKIAALEFRKGTSEEVIRPMITFCSGGVYKHHIDAVCLKLHSTSRAFNEGVQARLNRKSCKSPYYKGCQYSEYINWSTGYDSAALAIELHGRPRVIETL